VAAVLLAVSGWAYTGLPPAMRHPTPQAQPPPGYHVLGAWSWWDGAWYVGIAEHGYTFTFGRRRQSATAFFPAYPLGIRALTAVTRNPVVAGFILSLACGIGACLLFYAWAAELLGREVARTALAGLLLYPCSFYLFGVLYADALFLLAALAAFVFLEHDRPGLAGLAAAVATAARPIGIALVLGLWIRAVERRRQEAGLGGPTLVERLRHDRGLLLAPAGLVAYAGYLWIRFGDPWGFMQAERGWHQAPGLRTWLKVAWFRRMSRRPYLDPPHYHLVGNLVATVVALALAVVVVKKLGWGYGVYAVAVVVGAAASTKDFVGMGRYALSAFPCFAAAGALLADRARLRFAALAGTAGLLVLLTELHSRNMLIS